MNGDERGEAGLTELVRFARRRWAWIVVCAVGAAVVAAALSSRMEPMYESSAKLAVHPPSNASETERALFGDTDIPSQLSLIQSAPVLQQVLEQAHLPATDAAVRSFQSDHLTVQQDDAAPEFKIEVTDRDPEVAAVLAQGVAEQYLAFLDREAGERLAKAVRELRANDIATRQQLRSLEGQVASRPGKTGDSLAEERDALYAQLRFSAARVTELQTVKAFTRLGYVLEPAQVPTSPSSPRPLRNAALALVLGAMLGVGLAFVRDRTDDSVSEPQDVAAAGAGALLGLVHVPDAERPVDTVDLDAMRQVRTNVLATWGRADRGCALALLPLDASRRGRPAVAAGIVSALAEGLSRTERRVVLVHADFDAGTAGTGPGLRELLTDADADLPTGARGPQPGLQVVPAGAGLDEVADLLSGPRFPQLLEKLSRGCDHLLVAGPRLDLGAIALDVAVAAGAAVLVAPSHVRGRALRQAAEQLTAVGVPPLGVILWTTGRRGRGGARPGVSPARQSAQDPQLVP